MPPKLAPIQWILDQTIVDEQIATNIPVTKNEVKFVTDASDDDEEVSISTTISLKYLKY